MTASTWPVVSESVEWRVYDVDKSYLGILMVDVRTTPRISNDTSRSVRRSVSSIVVPPRPNHDLDPNHFYAEDVDPFSMRVKPWWVYGDGTEWPLGLFLWGDASTMQLSSGSPLTGTLTDLCAALDQPLAQSVGFAARTSLDDAIASLIPSWIDPSNVQTTGQTIAADVGFAAGRDTTLTALDSLGKIAGMLPPYFDNDGEFVMRTAPNIASAPVDFSYDEGTVVPGSAVLSNDLMTAPNRYVVTGGDVDAELVGVFDVPGSAPNSYENIGYYRVKSSTVQGIEQQYEADAAAAAAYATDSSSYLWLGFDAARVNPAHDTWNVVSHDGVKYREVGWDIEARAGGTMHHTLRGAAL